MIGGDSAAGVPPQPQRVSQIANRKYRMEFLGRLPLRIPLPCSGSGENNNNENNNNETAAGSTSADAKDDAENDTKEEEDDPFLEQLVQWLDHHHHSSTATGSRGEPTTAPLLEGDCCSGKDEEEDPVAGATDRGDRDNKTTTINNNMNNVNNNILNAKPTRRPQTQRSETHGTNHTNHTSTSNTAPNRRLRQKYPDFGSTDCHPDLLFLKDCRTRSRHALQSLVVDENAGVNGEDRSRSRMSNSNSNTGSNNTRSPNDDRSSAAAAAPPTTTTTRLDLLARTLPVLQEYAAALEEFCQKGFPVTDDWRGECDHHLLQHSTSSSSSSSSTFSSSLTLSWKSVTDGHGLSPHIETHHSLAWERANVLYNIAVVFLYQAECHVAAASTSTASTSTAAASTSTASTASVDATTTRLGWSKAGLLLQQSATIVHCLRETELRRTGPLHASLALSSNFLLIWECYLLAEAQRAAYQTFRAQIRPKHFMLAKLAAAAVPLFQAVEDLCSNQDARLTCVELVVVWEDSVRARGMWMTAMTEYHQSVVHREKQERGLELARLEGALKLGNFCKEFCESSDLLASLAEQQLNPILNEIDRRFDMAETENDELFHESVPEHDELSDVSPQLSVKTDPENIAKLLPPLSKPLFSQVMDPVLRKYIDTFRSEIQKVVTQTEKLAEEKSEAGRCALASVNLPHSFATFRQEQNGGGLPLELWERIESVQKESKVVHLTEELWKLRSQADSARSIFRSVVDHLEDDLESDTEFRKEHAKFEGHDVNEIQAPFRQALLNYQRLMLMASESDDLLIRRSETLVSDPKFRLLRLHKMQLDRLVPVGLDSPDVDVSLLSQMLVDLSVLFSERDSLRHNIKELAKTYNISNDLLLIGQKASAAEYRQVVDRAKASFQDVVDEMKDNLERQTLLVSSILQENDKFLRVRDQSQAAIDQDSPIVKIKDALDEIDQISNHLEEGMSFYDVVTPRLDRLQQQAAEVSDRLSKERLSYEEYLSGRHESSEQRLAGNRNRYDDYRIPQGNRMTQIDQRPSARSHGRTDVRIDDEKLASLVAMDFDADKVVEALRKHENNFEQALNELLSLADS